MATAPDSTRVAPTHDGFPSVVSGVEDQIVVTLAPGSNAAAVAAAYGATLVSVLEGFAVLRPAPNEQIEDVQLRMKNDARVLTSEPNEILVPAEVRQKSWSFDDGLGCYQTYASQPVLSTLGILQAHAFGRGDGVKVAILDTGIDPAHPVFAGHIAGGWDFVDNDPNPTDVLTGVDLNGNGRVDEAYGHGTHVAGIVMLTAPGVRLLPVRVLDSEGRGDVHTVAAGIRWAVSNGAQVINMSLGMLRASSAISVAIHEAAEHGVVCVSSAGNWGSDTPAEYPAVNPEVIAVGADDAFNQPAPFTSYGSFVDLCAPGVGVRSAFPGGAYRVWSGTSMSAPFVSGTAAVIKGRNPGWGFVDVLAFLQGTTRPIVGETQAQLGRLGSGALTVYGTLYALAGPADFKDRAAGDLETGP
jgi:hypothetical protein